VIGVFQQGREINLLEGRFFHSHMGIGDQNAHAHAGCERRHCATDRAIADDADCGAGQLPPHPRNRHPARLKGRGGRRYATVEIDQEAQHQFGHGFDKTGFGTGDEDAVR
jgi:hypothetical protein